MKKKGFTLVELLAVIAILAILVIIALPNVMGMFNQAKENSFTTEIKEIYKQAQQQWISDSMMSTSTISYYRYNKTASGTTTAVSGATLSGSDGIKLTGRTQLEYYITIDKSGKVTAYYATDGSYQYYYADNAGLEVENIGTGTGTSNKVIQVSNIPSISGAKYVCVGEKPVSGSTTITGDAVSDNNCSY